MNKLFLLFVALFFFISCNNHVENKIEHVSITTDYYRSALDEITLAYKSKPSDELLRRKLYFLKLLDWPKGSVETLQDAQTRFGLTDEIVHNLAGYYLSKGSDDELSELLRDWKRYAQLDRELAQMEIELLSHHDFEPMRDAVIQYSKTFHEEKDLLFVRNQLQLFTDTVGIVPVIAKLAESDQNNILIKYWLVPVLLGQERTKEARKYLLPQLLVEQNQETLLLLAESFLKENADTAKVILRGMENLSSFNALSAIFELEKRYDSAIYYVDQLISLDSTRNLMFRKASLLEKRRWLTSSYYLFNLLSESDSTDSISRKRARVVGNKIAYLRSLEELEEDVPILELKSKKQVENE